jgi:hypothetical protein
MLRPLNMIALLGGKFINDASHLTQHAINVVDWVAKFKLFFHHVPKGVPPFNRCPSRFTPHIRKWMLACEGGSCNRRSKLKVVHSYWYPVVYDRGGQKELFLWWCPMLVLLLQPNSLCSSVPLLSPHRVKRESIQGIGELRSLPPYFHCIKIEVLLSSNALCWNSMGWVPFSYQKGLGLLSPNLHFL